jgi:Flp pilus assembly pilin Flp
VFQTFLLAATLCPAAFGQAAAEYGIGAARAVTMTAPAANLGNGIKGVFDTLNKTIEPDKGAASGSASSGMLSPKPQRSPRSKQAIGPAGRKPTATAAAGAAYEDPKQIHAGIAYDELVRRFGPPSMSIMGETGRSALSYSSRNNLVQVEVEDGKVISVVGAQSE